MISIVEEDVKRKRRKDGVSCTVAIVAIFLRTETIVRATSEYW